MLNVLVLWAYLSKAIQLNTGNWLVSCCSVFYCQCNICYCCLSLWRLNAPLFFFIPLIHHCPSHRQHFVRSVRFAAILFQFISEHFRGSGKKADFVFWVFFLCFCHYRFTGLKRILTISITWFILLDWTGFNRFAYDKSVDL